MIAPRFIQNWSDQQLTDEYRITGDLEVLAVLYQRYTSLIYGTCLKYLKDPVESQDAVMNIFEQLIGSLQRHHVQQFKSWLYTVVRNYCLMHIRNQQSQNFNNRYKTFMESGVAVHLEEDNNLEFNLAKMGKCLETLKAEQKWCVELFYLDQKCYKDIVQLTGFEEQKVKSYIQNGKRNLKNCMQQYEE